jgi:glycosyltransferase involved in cell wall biosynthesis
MTTALGERMMVFVHEGKAAYPDVRAYMTYFGDRYHVRECSFMEAAALPGIERAVCWHMMGFYSNRVPCAISIHDYRSLSVGRGRRLKDIAKRLLNADPDIRLFQNDAIRRALRFESDQRTRFLAMGVPSQFIAERERHEPVETDFIYIGSMLPERGCERMLDSFLRRFGNSRRFDLYGPRNSTLEARYAGETNIIFHGLIDQAELPRVLKGARVGVAFFPDHYPHVLQTPTKLMEYGALGMRILANEHPQSRITARDFGLHCLWGSIDDLFADVPETLNWESNAGVDPAQMAWPAVIAASGIEELLVKLLRQKS